MRSIRWRHKWFLLVGVVLLSCNNTSPDISKPTVQLVVESSTLNTPGTVKLTATATDNIKVTRVEFYRGSNKLGEDTSEPYEQSVSLNIADNGTVIFSARAYDAAGNTATSTPISITVDIPPPNNPPTVSLVVSNTNLTSPTTITLTATASDDKGIAKLEFYEGGTKLGEDASSPYTWEIPITANHNGTRSYSAIAFDTDNAQTNSNTLTITVDIDGTPPTVSLVSSTNNLTAPGNITLVAAAVDNKEVTKVEFFEGAAKIGEDPSAEDGFSINVSLTATDNGTKAYSAKAFDAAGNSAASNSVSVTVNIEVVQPTTITSIEASASPTTVQTGASSTLFGTLQGTGNFNKTISWQIVGGGGTLSADSSQSGQPLSYTAPNAAGSVTLRAIAVGNTSLFKEISLTIVSVPTNTPPKVSLTSSSNSVTTAGSITLTASATDDKGVSKVEFYDGNDKIGEDTTPANGFTQVVNLTAAHNGTRTYRAKAIDNENAEGISNTVAVTVDIDATPPTITLVSSTAKVMR